MVLKLLQVAQGSQRPFTAETIQTPEYDQVELLLISFEQQVFEFRAVSLPTRFLVCEYLVDGTMTLGEFP